MPVRCINTQNGNFPHRYSTKLHHVFVPWQAMLRVPDLPVFDGSSPPPLPPVSSEDRPEPFFFLFPVIIFVVVVFTGEPCSSPEEPEGYLTKLT